ncbi:hypothetical protein TVAG_185310 [Trichomonas vaginalis G3]|uniref:Uncharacterized protein n=1 Tax=Trichomonas vaginalis (strain ATCC PRA-98 / G3) TaxID=412133 RepID=A2D8H6_TRIV3|nr:hypothetical protein TVAGG3_0393070 [Trichomonas vaginalis G3]EAY23225.1 hypothetical protein TVAG_185310 [Trichomonas vaginalis G3]KAI5534126.1 hypothetical protein TVAGG3_0393070 [Trichomonas vaginalis G3]|eukprot:XP_001584211.1 hypothetical protein [Trichomonas vaginalis G3]
MGLIGSQDAALDHLNVLFTENLMLESPFFDDLFKYKIDSSKEKTIKTKFSENFETNIETFKVLYQRCSLSLENIYNSPESNTKSFSTETIVIILEFVISLASKSTNPKEFLSINLKDDFTIADSLISLFLHEIDILYDPNDTNPPKRTDREILGIIRILTYLKLQRFKVPHQNYINFVNYALCKTHQVFLSPSGKGPSYEIQVNISQTSLILILLLKINIPLLKIKFISLYQPFTDTSSFKYRNETIYLLVVCALNIKSAIKDIIKKKGFVVFTNLLNILDTIHLSNFSPYIMYIIMRSIDSKTFTQQFNLPFSSNKSFNIRFHRGTYLDVTNEIICKCLSDNKNLYDFAIPSIAKLILNAKNISYFTAMTILDLISATKSLLLINCLHYTINNGIRSNISLIIVMMKKSNIFFQLQKLYPDSQEVNSIVVMLKNINTELKQIGDNFTDVFLENFFQDPTCEHFANPVLRVPSTEMKVQLHHFEFFGNLAKINLEMTE